MEIEAADILINEGGWTVETTSGVSDIVVPAGGFYSVSVHAFFDGSGGRTNLQARIRRTRGTDVVYGIAGTGGYLRGSGTFSVDAAAVKFTQLWQFSSGDKVSVQCVNTADQSIDLDGDESWISIVKIEGKTNVEGGGGGEGSAPDGAGYVYDISETNGGTPPTPTEANSGNLYFNRDVGRLFIPHRDPSPGEPAVATSTLIAAGGSGTGFRGVRHAAPSTSQNGDFYYRIGNHTWKLRTGGFYRPVAWNAIKEGALNSSDTAFFGANDVWLNEVDRLNIATAILENLGTYDGTKDYFFIIGTTFYKIATFTGATDPGFTHDYIPLSKKGDEVAYWYLHGQTERDPTTFPYTQDRANNKIRIRFAQAAPNERFFGWEWGDHFVDGDDVTDLDTGGEPTSTTDHVVFRPAAGIWRLELYISSGITNLPG